MTSFAHPADLQGDLDFPSALNNDELKTVIVVAEAWRVINDPRLVKIDTAVTIPEDEAIDAHR